MSMLLGLAFKRQLIARKLFDNESIERLVLVDRVHDIVAISPRIAVSNVFIQPIGVSIPRDIQPVTSPVFAIGGGFQQAVNNFRESIRLFITQEVIDLRLPGG